MAKKIILIIAALFGVLLLGLIFQFMNNDLGDSTEVFQRENFDKSLLQDDPSDKVEAISAGGVSVQESEEISLRVPGKREFGYEKRVSNADGMFQVLNPWAKLYSKNNVVRITAQHGLVQLSDDGQLLSSSGPEQGILEGDVSIEVFRKPDNVSFDDFDYKPEHKELAIKLGKTKFELEFSRIVSEGEVRVISSQFLATGQDLVMQYDQIDKKLQLLEISQLQKLVVTIKKDKDKTQNKTDQPSEPTPPVVAAPADFMTYYLNLTNNISVQTQQESFTADSLSIMADIAGGDEFIEDSKNRTKDQDQQLVANNSIDSENYRIITMTCNGPLIITSPDKTYHAEDGLPRVEITASGRPVEIYRDGLPALKADKIVYSRNTDKGNHTIKLISQDSYRDLYLAQGISQTVSAASEISYDFKTDIATLAGPGVINSTISNSDKTKIEFQDTISVKFESLPNTAPDKINIPLNSNRQVEWVECVGKVVATLKEGLFSAEKAVINFDLSKKNTPEPESKDKPIAPAIDNMVMSGNVTMTNGKSNFNCDKLILRFREENGLTEPLSLWAGGKVKAENEDYIIQASDRLLINFGKIRAALESETANNLPKTETAFSGMDKMFANLNPVYVIAEGENGGVTFRNKLKNFSVRGSSIEGKLPDIDPNSPPELAISTSSNSLSQDGIWKILGGSQLAVVQLSDNRTFSNPVIELDQATGFCRLPGTGSLNLIISGDYSGASMPVNIKWNDGVVYNIANNIVALRKATFEIDRLTGGNILQNIRLYAENVDIEISAIADSVDSSSRPEFKNFHAYGPGLTLLSNDIDLEHNDLLNQSRLHASQILFESQPKPILTASGGGWLEHIALCQPDTTKTTPEELDLAGPENKSAFRTGYYFLQFTKSMVMDITNSDVSFNDPVGLHYLPLTDTAPREVSINADNSLPAGGVRMYCDKLRLVNSQAEKDLLSSSFGTQANSGSLAASLGNGALGYACASGNIFLEHTDSESKEHYFTASELLFDRGSEKFGITGSEETPVRYDQMQFEYLSYDLSTGSYNGRTLGQSEISN